MYIYEYKNWTDFTWDNNSITDLLGSLRHMQGRLIGKMESLGFELKNEAGIQTLSADVQKSSEIEGEILNIDQVRSSIAKQLGVKIPGYIKTDRNIDGIVEMMMDASQNPEEKLTKKRLFRWHSLLFPAGRKNIIIGKWRNDKKGPMQVVSGAMGKEKIHFQAPSAEILDKEMTEFINWFNADDKLDLVLKAGIAHLYFITLHPFDDGNGRIARALTDMLLARSDGSFKRYYSMSAQIQKQRKEYYLILEKTQKNSPYINEWLIWFLNCLSNAINSTNEILASVLFKANFWNRYNSKSLNKRQIFILNKLLDKFEGNLTTSKWAKITKCSQDTALRDIQDLIDKRILKKSESGGRSTSYELNEFV
jgi:Fic family protein